MIPQRFAEANQVLHRPANLTEEQCQSVHAHVSQATRQVVTCWKPTAEELVKINLGEPIWLILWGGMPPACLTVERPFVEVYHAPPEKGPESKPPAGS